MPVYGCMYHRIANDGTKFYIRTNANAPKYKLIVVDVDEFVKANKGGPVHINQISRDLIPEDKDALLEDVTVVGHDRLMTMYKRNVSRLNLILLPKIVSSQAIQMLRIVDTILGQR